MKRVLTLILATAMILAVSGCSNSTPAPSATSSSAGASKPAGTAESSAASSSTPTWKPEETIDFVCQSSPGGGSDIMARTIADIMNSQKLIDQPIVVQNLTGSGGVQAFNYTQQHAEDPYVWQTVNSGFFVAPITGNTDKTYQDYTILGVLGTDPNILCAPANSKYNTLEDVVEAAKANPKGLSICIGSAGSSGSCCSILFEQAAGIEMTQVPFEGGGDGLTAVMGSQVDFSWQNIGEVVGPVESGLMKVIAIAAEERSDAFPDVPTFKELGYDVVYEVPRGIVGPPDMPPEAVAFYTDALEKLNTTDEWQKNYIEANFIFPRFAVGNEALQIFDEFYNDTYNIFDKIGLAVH